MMNYNIFTKEVVEVVQQNLLNLLNSDVDFQNKYIVSNPRAVGDAVQEMIGENLIKCFPDNLVRVCNETFLNNLSVKTDKRRIIPKRSQRTLY